MTEIERAPNVGKVLGARLRAVGIHSRERLDALGDVAAFSELCARFPEDACTHTRLALAGAVRGIRWYHLDEALRRELTAGLHR